MKKYVEMKKYEKTCGNNMWKEETCLIFSQRKIEHEIARTRLTRL